MTKAQSKGGKLWKFVEELSREIFKTDSKT